MDISDFIRVGISGLAGTFLTPFIMNTWSRLSPPKEVSKYDKYSFDELEARNSKINSIASALSVLGIFLAIPFYFVLGFPKSNPWPVGLGFGLMVILPTTYISIVTYSESSDRFQEFWRFYELNYNIGIKSLTIIYVLVGLLGLISAYQIVFTS